MSTCGEKPKVQFSYTVRSSNSDSFIPRRPAAERITYNNGGIQNMFNVNDKVIEKNIISCSLGVEQYSIKCHNLY